MATEKFLTLDDFLGVNRQTYTWHVPSLDADVELNRLTHGQVKSLNEQYRAAGNRITEEMQDAIVEMGLARPAVSVAQLNAMVGNATALAEIYTQIASECGFIVVLPKAAKGSGASAETSDAPDPLAATAPAA